MGQGQGVVLHMVRALSSDFNSGSVFPAVCPWDRSHKSVHRQLDNESDDQNRIRHGDIDLAFIVLAGAVSYT